MKALLIGREPTVDLGYEYADAGYDAVVIGSLNLGQLLKFREEAVLEALAQGKLVFLTPLVFQLRRRIGHWPPSWPPANGS